MRKTLLLAPVAAAVALALSPVAQADDAGTTTISNTGFIDFTSINTKNAGATVDPNGYGLDVTRWYLTVLHTIDDTWSTNLTTDFNLLSNKDSVGGKFTEGETQVFIKKAYLQGKFSDMAVLHIGSYDMPWAPYVEGIYGYRFVEKTLTDRESFSNTADWGINLSGNNGMFNYSASMVNGGGFKNPSRSKGMDFDARLGFVPVDGLTIAVDLFSGKRGLDTETTPAVNTASRQDLLVAWKASGLTVGAEYMTADKYNDVLTPAGSPTTKSDGYSVFGSFDIPNTDYSVFARDDSFKPKKDTDSSLEDKYFNAGFAWKTNKNLTWAFAYKNDKLSDSSGVDVKTEEFGVWAQVKF
ncbi:MAG TPA: carbohydrate porin [Gammaproteobacteria bacterium]|nr:carbohydrate porin [Gammaproteobacteria bacterium]